MRFSKTMTTVRTFQQLREKFSVTKTIQIIAIKRNNLTTVLYIKKNYIVYESTERKKTIGM